MPDPSRSSDSSKTYDELSKILQETLARRKHNASGDKRSRPPPRHKSTPVTSRNSGRNFRLASSRALQLDSSAGVTDSSNSSLDMSGLSLEAAVKVAKTASSGTMATSFGSLLNDSASSLPGAGAAVDPALSSMSRPGNNKKSSPPQRCYSMDRTPSFTACTSPRGASSRVSTLRREMSQTTLLRKGNNSRSSLGGAADGVDDPIVQNNPQIVVLTRTPSQRFRKQKPSKTRSSCSIRSPPLSDGDGNATELATWTRNRGSPKKSDDKHSAFRKHLESEKQKRSSSKNTAKPAVVGGSMRNILRNKRRLEKELHKSDIFHYVLHKAPPSKNEKTKMNEQQYPDSSTPNNSSSTKSSKRTSSTSASRRKSKGGEPQPRRMSLDKFLVMKQQSEQLVEDNDIISAAQPTVEEEMSGTWRTTSIDLSTSLQPEPSSSLVYRPSAAHADKKEELVLPEDEDDEQEEDDSDYDGDDTDDEDDDESVLSLDIQHVLDRNDHAATSSNPRAGMSSSNHASGATLLSEEMESQTLSLNLDDIQLADGHDDDEHSGQDSEHSLENVTDYAVADPKGRKGIYSGLISRSSGMPCGQGRLEYPEEGEVFEGQFVHGYWTGYGRCIFYSTGEDYTGTFLDNIRHGHGICKYQDGRVFEGTYTNGVKTEGKMTYQDGSTYLGHWLNGARHGRGTYTFANGSVFIGEFEDDRMHGSGVLTWSNGTRFVGTWKNGLRHGQGKEFRPNGTIRREGLWNEGAFVKDPR